jgi:hypothetical protein
MVCSSRWKTSLGLAIAREDVEVVDVVSLTGFWSGFLLRLNLCFRSLLNRLNDSTRKPTAKSEDG